MSGTAKILMVEDDLNLGYLVKENLESKGYEVHLCANGDDGKKAFVNNKFDICLLDVMMPSKDGFSLAKEIRMKDEQLPIIFVTSKASERDKLEGFNLGADDYVTKPFSIKELLLRINAVLKRSMKEEPIRKQEAQLVVGKFTFDVTNRLLKIGDSQKVLSIKETELLKIFIEHKNLLVNRSVIMNKVWGNDDFFVAKSMDVYITRLRKLLRDDPSIEIQNLYGTGFKLLVKE